MKRRIFLQSGSVAAATALAGCGGGSGGSGAGPASPDTAVGATTSVTAAPQPSDGTSAVPATAPTPAPAPSQQATSTVPGVAYPFGSRLVPYVAGILPSNASNAQMDARIRSFYDAWKAHGIVDVPTIAGGKALRFSSSYITVSEGMGYGMLIAVVMAGHDPGARALFDALLTTARARPAYAIPAGFGAQYLMDWRLDSSGNSAGDGWNAMDGDLDIAMALLMADRQWGSSGSWNYKQEALNTIGALKAWNMKPDGTTKGLPSANNNRTSDYMVGHFRAFRRATGDTLWDAAVDRAYWLLNYIQTTYSPACGLIPDFIINTDSSTPAPSQGYIGDGTPTEGYYFANAERDPWRLGTDYVLSGDPRFKTICQRLTTFLQNDCAGDPASLAIGYHLDGTSMGRSYPPKAIIGPLQCGAMVDASYQPFLNSCWSWTSSNFVTDYYDSELMLIPMIVASGNWWTV
ncbi:MAG: glycosyl hydrolase family 8 [Ramlibacter sp.]